MGWLPAIFPTVFLWSNEATGWTVRARRHDFNTQRHVERFFGLSSELFASLFAGQELVVNDRVLIPAVANMRTVSKADALSRVGRAIQLMKSGQI